MTAPLDSRHILLVEDDPADFESAVRALRTAGLLNPIVHCTDGEEALAYLTNAGEYADPERAPRPAVVLLDLHLQARNGFELLEELQRTEGAAEVPVIVLTSILDEVRLEACLEAGAAAVIRKPVDLDQFLEALKRLENYWFEVVLVPRDVPAGG